MEGQHDDTQSIRPASRKSVPTSVANKPETAKSSGWKKAPTHPAREPTEAMKRYCSSHYNIYDATITPPPLKVSGKFKSFAQYDNFTLYVNPGVTSIDDIPKHGVRLDDMTIYFVFQAYSNKLIKKLDFSRYWPADFDKACMIRATRYPLGNAAKVYVPEGSEDGKGVKIRIGGWHYRWYGNIHVLCGEEGADEYLIRPSYEKLEAGFTFRADWRCKVQASVPGAPDAAAGASSMA